MYNFKESNLCHDVMLVFFHNKRKVFTMNNKETAEIIAFLKTIKATKLVKLLPGKKGTMRKFVLPMWF